MEKNWLKNLKPKYDVVIIGAGLGGLTAANRLAKLGRSVLLLEQHYLLGGLATWFKRKGGHVFDVALHGFPVGMIKTCRKYWSKEIADTIVQLEDIRFDNPQFTLSTKFDEADFTSLLETKFGIARGNIESFFAEIRRMAVTDDTNYTVGALFEKHFPGRDDIVRLLMEPITYANGSTLLEPALTYGIVFSNFMSKGVYTVRGGTDMLIRMMKHELEKNGVDIRHHALVERIEVDGGAVRGVTVNGRFVPARSVLSNANVVRTVRDMVGYDKFPPEFKPLVESVKINNSSCQVYLGIKKGEKVPFTGDLLFTSTAPKFDSGLVMSKDITSRTFSFYYPKTRPGSDRYTIVASMNAEYSDWAGLSQDVYGSAKRKLIEDTIDSLEKYVPGVRKKIDHAEAATPLTFERYTHHPLGASFGTKFEGLKVSTELPKLVRGLYHTGSVGIIMSGWLGAANYGVIVANNIDLDFTMAEPAGG